MKEHKIRMRIFHVLGVCQEQCTRKINFFLFFSKMSPEDRPRQVADFELYLFSDFFFFFFNVI